MTTTAVEFVFLASGNMTNYSVGPSHEWKPLLRSAGPFFSFALNETALVSRFLAKRVVKPKRRFKKSLILGHKKDVVSM